MQARQSRQVLDVDPGRGEVGRSDRSLILGQEGRDLLPLRRLPRIEDADGAVQPALGEVDRGVGFGDLHPDSGMPGHEARQPGDQPFQREGAETGNLDLALVVAAGCGHGVRDGRKGHGQAVGQFGSGRRQGQPVARSDHKGDAEMVLKRGDLPADRSVGDAQFGRRSRHSAMPREGLEGAERVERRWGGGLHVISAHRLSPV